MDLTLESKACCACARAKRKCGRQIPTCGRCQSRGIRCDYLTPKSSLPLPPELGDEMLLGRGTQSSSWLEYSAPEQAAVLEAPLVLDADTLFDPSEDDNGMHIDDLFPLSLSGAFPSPSTKLNPKPTNTALPWFLEPNSWEIDQLPEAGYNSPMCSSVLDNFIQHFHNWLATWVDTGACIFIHSRLYVHQFPRCVQDAYTALSSYQNRKPSNKTIILGLVEKRMQQLLKDQPTPTSTGTEHDSPMSTLTPFELLSRVHALIVYQIIGLYDGDIRLRHITETQTSTLNSWMRQLLQSARATAREGSEGFIASMLFPSPTRYSSTETSFDDQLDMTSLSAASSILTHEGMEWYAWLFAETIRRTWLVACTVQGIYHTLRVRWTPCPGGLPFTARDGLWDAGSAFTWASRCEGIEKQEGAGVDFIRRNECPRVFEQRRPEEVDLFATRMLEMTCGLERVERWKIDMGGKE